MLEHVVQTEKVIDIALNECGFSAQYVKRPLTEKDKLKAVRNTGFCISLFKDPSEKLQCEAVKSNPIAIVAIDDPCQKAIDLAHKLKGEQYKASGINATHLGYDKEYNYIGEDE